MKRIILVETASFQCDGADRGQLPLNAKDFKAKTVQQEPGYISEVKQVRAGVQESRNSW